MQIRLLVTSHCGHKMCGSRKYPYSPLPPTEGHGNSKTQRGVKEANFQRGGGVYKELFFPEGLKCDRIKHLQHTFFWIQGNQETLNILSVEIT